MSGLLGSQADVIADAQSDGHQTGVVVGNGGAREHDPPGDDVCAGVLGKRKTLEAVVCRPLADEVGDTARACSVSARDSQRQPSAGATH